MIGRLLEGVRAGRSGSLVVRGPAGIGKTALLDLVAATAVSETFRVIASVGAEPEREFAFAGLQRLCTDLLGGMDDLPEPQQNALGVALGTRSGSPPDRFTVGLATLNLLVDAAEITPLVVLVDDVQWLDEASADVLAFVARRMTAERILIVFATRDMNVDGIDSLVGLTPEISLTGLGDEDSRTLLRTSAMYAPIDKVVQDRVIAEARGNPLALLELPRSAAPGSWAGGYGPPDALTVPSRVEESFRRRSEGLPDETRALLLIAAADSTGDVSLLWRAAAYLGIRQEAVEPAEGSGLLTIGARVRFRHPLVRSAIYRAASPPERRRAHEALAQVTDLERDTDRRAWHHAQAVLGTSEEIASELERLAGRTAARGGVAAAAAFLRRSTELTPDSEKRARRALAAAHSKHDAGASEEALELLSIAASGPLDALQSARSQLLRARIRFHLTKHLDSPRMFVEAAEAFVPLDACLARETYLTALDAAVITGTDVRSVAQAVLELPPPRGPSTGEDLLLEGLVTAYTNGFVRGVPELQRAMDALRRDARDPFDQTDGNGWSWLWLASRVAAALFDDESMLVFARLNVRRTREVGALTALPAALVALSASLVLKGELTQAAELTAEGAAITEAIGAAPLRYADLFVAAWRGDQAATTALYAASTVGVAGNGRGAEQSLANYALAVLHNGLSNYDLAYEAALRVCDTDELPNSSLALPELVEAAIRSDRRAAALTALAELESRTIATGTHWGLGLAARSRALVTDGAEAEDLYRESVLHLDSREMTGHLARTRLVFGEWLRRSGRRQDARAELRAAHELLSTMGASAFAARAERELQALGEFVRARTTPTLALTERELHIARLVAAGATSREIGAQLFVSHRTIDAHLRNIFSKLGITSRRQLRSILPS